ncbi:t-SNARE [Xylariaceae sp. FL1272]|nr:t-SNARE [Xylariaceae sp. FL1272]
MAANRNMQQRSYRPQEPLLKKPRSQNSQNLQDPFGDSNVSHDSDDDNNVYGSSGRGELPSSSYGNDYGHQYGNEDGSDVEMKALPLNKETTAAVVRSKITEIQVQMEAINELRGKWETAHKASLGEADVSPKSATNQRINKLSTDIIKEYTALVGTVGDLKRNPQYMRAARPNIEAIQKALKQATDEYQKRDKEFREKAKQQMMRQYILVNPEASPEEAKQAVQGNTNPQLTQDTIPHRNNTDKADAVWTAIYARHDQLQNINQQIKDLAELVQQLDNLVMEQEETIVTTEKKTEDVGEDLVKGNENVAVAVNTARATRNKKWWCLGISILIFFIVFGIAFGITYVETGGFGNGKRSLSELSARDLVNTQGATQLILPKFHSRINSETRRWLMSTTT